MAKTTHTIVKMMTNFIFERLIPKLIVPKFSKNNFVLIANFILFFTVDIRHVV